MIDKFLKEVVEVVVGKQAELIVDLINTSKHVSEFTIAKKLNLTINQTRNILYKLSNHGLVSSTRKKDKKKGWFTYFWKMEKVKALEFLKEIILKKLNQFNKQINSRESKQFYVCERCKVEFNEENALLNNFTCNECGDIFTVKDNSKLLREFQRNKDKLEKKLALINEEITKEFEKEEKEKEKEMKKQAKAKGVKTSSAKKIKKTEKKVIKISKKTSAKKKVTKKPVKKIVSKKTKTRKKK